MPAVCLYFQMHQPIRLAPYSALDIGQHLPYYDERMNRDILQKVSNNCYIPAIKSIYDLIRRHRGKFKVAFSISGLLLEQLEKQRPDVLRSLQSLVDTGCVEFLSETYYHSLAFAYNREEFFRQVILHKEKIWQHFHQDPQVFRNTELIYHNQLAFFVRQMGFRGILTEGVPRLLKGRSSNQLYMPPDLLNMQLFLRNSFLADEIGFRFEDEETGETLSAEAYAKRIHSQDGELVNVFLDFETFGEHKKAETGIFHFLEKLPEAILSDDATSFILPSEVLNTQKSTEIYDSPDYISWADEARDLSAWNGNDLQKEALQKVYELQAVVLSSQNQQLIEEWSRMQVSDHFYYMSTKDGADGEVHEYFTPFPSPYDAYSALMNVIADFQLKLRNAHS